MFSTLKSKGGDGDINRDADGGDDDGYGDVGWR